MRDIMVLVVLGALASVAYAHGGTYQPPPEPPPRPPAGQVPSDVREPNDPPPPGDPPPPPTTPSGDPPPPTTPPTTPGGDGEPPVTPDGGFPPPPPLTGGGSPPPPLTGGGGPAPIGPATSSTPRGASSGTLSVDHWSRWWYANRSFLVDLSARVWESGARTPASRESDSDALWRAELQGVLAKSLHDKNEDIASGAAIALGKSGDPSHAPALTRVLLDKRRQQTVRESAALALGLLPPSTDVRQSVACRVALENVASSRKERNRLRGTAAYALGMRAEIASLPFLLDASQSPQSTWDLQAASLSALGMTGQEMVRGDLEAVLDGGSGRKKSDRILQVYAAHGLAAMGSPKAIVALRKAARSREKQVRRAAVLALGALSNEADDLTADLLVRLIHRDKDRGVRNMAVLALARTGHAKAEPALRHAYKKGDRLHQPFAALALGLLARRNGNTELVKPLAADLKRRANADLRGSLAIAIGLGKGIDAAPLLREIVADRGDPTLRGHAALALGLMGDTIGGPTVLRPLLADARDPGLKREAALALGLLGDRKALEQLTETVTNGGSVYVRGSAAVALGRIGGRDAGKALLSLLKDEKRPAIGRAMAAVGLGLLLDRTNGKSLARAGADLNWYLQTSTVQEILTIL